MIPKLESIKYFTIKNAQEIFHHQFRNLKKKKVQPIFISGMCCRWIYLSMLKITQTLKVLIFQKKKLKCFNKQIMGEKKRECKHE